MQTSLSNRRINKSPWNQQAVDLSRMSTRVTEKNTACTDTLRLNHLGDCPEKDVKEMRKAVTLKRRFAEPLSMLHFLHLKSNWPKALTDSSLNKKSTCCTTVIVTEVYFVSIKVQNSLYFRFFLLCHKAEKPLPSRAHRPIYRTC